MDYHSVSSDLGEPEPLQAQRSVDTVPSTDTPTLSPVRSHATVAPGVEVSSDTTDIRGSLPYDVAPNPTHSMHHPAPLQNQTTRPNSRKMRLYEVCSGWWYWEICCILLSMGCMLAIIVILCTADGTALQDWKFMIQPNSLVSVFMTVAKSSLLLPIAECIS